MDKKPLRLGHITKSQKEALIDLVESNPNLIRQKLNNNLTYKESTKLWEEATRELNAIPGARKPWQSWRKCWRDLKNEVRQKLSGKKKYMGGTGGGGQSSIILCPLEERISVLIDDVTVSGHPVPESAVHLELPIDENNCFLILEEEPSNIITPTDPTNYSIVSETQNSSILEEAVRIETVVSQPGVKTPISQKHKRNVASQRLTQTIKTAEVITENIKNKNNMKETYYAKKLKLMERLAKAKEDSNVIKSRLADIEEKSLGVKLRMANSFEKMAECLTKFEK